ncbi:bromodomain adjacent to zinc finger domain protein 1A-like isoform X2 [Saccostrea echinata]|uniref:bromodomain adjacent to zinc finger domain protein 1A-like isoform X2 n=1 Tax=Saccostrea echinata TaxID=191078 RepID=UPI002A8194EB|nr:bromodomain adjacent to zinc finger domain protein 1A-like isoform X2 [Saccostrea echinata]
MPLLRRQPFHRIKPPPDLSPDEEVFHCKLTNEIFRDYEDFFERVILCNSLVWSCSITGRAGFTYQEALECEEKALKNLATFPSYLQRPILFLASLTHRSRLNDMNDDIFVFTKDRYFIDEMVEVMLGNERKTCKVLRVVPPAASVPEVNGCIIIDSDEEESSAKSKAVTLKADQYKYVVQEKGKTNITITVPAKHVSRKKGVYTRDKSKLYLKQFCESVQGIWRVKESAIKKKGLKDCSFSDFFAGPPPAFGYSESKRKSAGRREEDSVNSSDVSGLISSKSPKKKREDKRKDKERVEKVPPKPEEPEMPRLTNEEKAAIKEQFKQQKLAEKMALKEEIKKKRQEEMQKRREEKAQEKAKLMEERRIQAEIYKEWSRQRDDLECDDLKPLPELKVVQTHIQSGCFGDALMVIEFINCFKSLFDLREYFPKGFTYEILEKALLETDHNGLMTDILLMMMSAIFTLQEEEEAEEEELSKEDKANQVTGMEDMDDTMDMENMMDTATMCAQIPQLTHGTLLRKLPLDSFTLSEIVRLHILASGAKVSDKNVKYRYQQRGGYTSLDDPGLQFRKQEPTLMKLLATESVFDLQPSDKLKILNLLVQQFLTYAATRDTIEDNYDKLRQLKYDLRHLQWAEQRREKEELAMRYKRRMEEKQREREKAEQRRQKHLRELEERMKREEAGETVDDDVKIMEEEEEDDDDVAMTEEEKEAQRQREEEEDANKKAEFALQERQMIDKVLNFQHSCTLAPIGRDRMFRRYWVFQSIPGLFVEDQEEFVDERGWEIAPQKLTVSIVKPPQMSKSEKTEEHSNGSDKENESFNTSTANNSINTSQNLSTANPNDTANPSDLPQNTRDKKSDDDAITISDDENSKPASVKEDTDENEAVTQIKKRKKNTWMFLTSIEQFHDLINSLNERGFRESALKTALLERKNVILENIEDCPSDILCQSVTASLSREETRSESPSELTFKSTRSGPKRTSKGLIKNNSAQEILEINLRELLIDLEERIHVGGLGKIKVNDRQAWRSAIEKGSYDPQTDDPVFQRHDISFNEGDDDDKSISSEETRESVVKDLSKALLQIAMGVEHKYMGPPLGVTDVKSKAGIKKKDGKKSEDGGSDDEDSKQEESVPEKTTMERWEDSVLFCSSLAQVFLHLSTLEKSIIWQKSALHARCRICRRKGDAEQMLLCDKCDRGHHMYCLKPRLKHVPKGDWFCPDCKPKETKRSPLKQRRRTFTENESEDEDDIEEDEEEDSDEEMMEESDEEDEENDNVCAVCSTGGMLVCCDTCPLVYHLDCAIPPLKKVPRGKWQCQLCTGITTTGKIKLPKAKAGKKKSHIKSTPNSSKASSRKGSPRDSPLTVKQGKKRDWEDMDDDLTPKSRGKGRPKSKLSDVNGEEIKQYVSSSRGNSKVQSLKVVQDIINDLVKHEDSWPFLKPVSKKLVPDYYDIIAIPMDFSTIRNKLNNYEYVEVSELISDVRQIFSNCFEYNRKSTTEHKAGATLSKMFEKRIKEAHLEKDSPEPPPSKRQRKH